MRRVLVVGQGGREHALVRALRNSPSVREVHCAPGSDGIAQEALCHPVSVTDVEGLGKLCERFQFDLVVIGPEASLAAGVADELRRRGVLTFGPGQAAAQLEASKIFAKRFLKEAQIPTARAVEVASVAETLEAADSFKPPFVLKADGLAAGKGVILARDLNELKAAAERLFVAKEFGVAGQKALLEEFLVGREISYLVITDGQAHITLPLARDHKRLRDGDEGPNTGGMGVVAPVPLAQELRQKIEETVVERALGQLRHMGLPYRGVLYIGLMLTADGPSVLEFNVRFGDPEAQVLLPLLDGDWGDLFAAVAAGELKPARWKPLAAACVVLAAPGYPEDAKKGVAIEGDVMAHGPSSYFLHAGTRRLASGAWVTEGGRVLNALGLGGHLSEALKSAYRQAERVRWPGLQMRRDIGR